MANGGREEFERDVAELISHRGLRFGLAGVERTAPSHPKHRTALLVTDLNGLVTECTEDAGVRGVVNAMASHHKHRVILRHETMKAQERMQDVLGPYSRGPVTVHLHDHMDGQRDGFMRFSVHADLLSDSLRHRRTHITFRPHETTIDGGLRRLVTEQRRRRAMLEGGCREDVLTVCPVLATRVRTAWNPTTWCDMLVNGLADCNTPDFPHFRNGVLACAVNLPDGMTWNRGVLSIRSDMPDTVLTALRGRPLSDLLRHDLLPTDAVITTTSRQARTIRVTTKPTTEPFGPLLRETMARAEAATPGTWASMANRGVISEGWLSATH